MPKSYHRPRFVMKRRFFKLALLLLVPLALGSYLVYYNSWRPRTIQLPDDGPMNFRPGDLKFSPDGRYLLVTDYYSFAPVMVCDVATRRVVNTIKEAEVVHFLERGNRVAVFKRIRHKPHDYQARVLSFPELQPLKQHSASNLHPRFSATWPDDKTLAAQNKKGDIILWDTKTGDTKIIKLPLPTPALGNFYSLDFMPDSKTVLVSEISWKNSDEIIPSVQSWNIQTLQGHFVKGMANLSYMNAASNGICLLGENGNREIWDYQKEQRKRVIKGSFVESCLSPDGSLLATISTPNSTGLTNVELWDVNSGQRLRFIQGRLGGFNTLAFSPNSCTLAVGNFSGYVQLWRVK